MNWFKNLFQKRSQKTPPARLNTEQASLDHKVWLRKMDEMEKKYPDFNGILDSVGPVEEIIVNQRINEEKLRQKANDKERTHQAS